MGPFLISSGCKVVKLFQWTEAPGDSSSLPTTASVRLKTQCSRLRLAGNPGPPDALKLGSAPVISHGNFPSFLVADTPAQYSKSRRRLLHSLLQHHYHHHPSLPPPPHTMDPHPPPHSKILERTHSSLLSLTLDPSCRTMTRLMMIVATPMVLLLPLCVVLRKCRHRYRIR